MRQDILNLLKDEFKQGKIETKNDILLMIKNQYITGDNQKFQKMYDWMSRGYDMAETVIGKIRYGDAVQKLRSDFMSKLEWKDNCKVLYVSIGTGRDLSFIPKSIDVGSLEIVGLDISLGMLRQCQRKYGKKLNLSLINCAAEELPFINDSFDIVFHVGGINFFSNKRSAITEMFRVAKPNSKILIADETADYIHSQYKKSGLSKEYFKNAEFDLGEIEESVPEMAREKNIDFLWDNKFYCLTFRK